MTALHAIPTQLASQPTVDGHVTPVDPRTDDGNALQLVNRHGQTIRRVLDAGTWFRWDATRWTRDHGDAQVREHARALARQLPAGDKDERIFRRNSLSATGISAATRLAATDARVSLPAAELDAHPHLLNTPSGTVDLRTGSSGRHNPDHLITRTTTVGAAVGAPCPRWEAFLRETFDSDQEMIGYLQRLSGLALLGDVREHVLPLFYGTGANGKGALLLVWQLILGVADTGGYAVSAPDGFLMETRHTGHPTEIARLRAARLVVASEQTGGKRFDEAKVKRLTGGDMLTGRVMRGDFFDFPPSHLIIVATNHLPEVREGGPSFWRRARLLPFTHVVPEDRRDPTLHNRLIEREGPAILGWMIEGAAAVIGGGLNDPDRVRRATDEYRINEDTLASFLRDECLTGPDHFVVVADFMRSYETHCRDMGQDPLSTRAIGMRLVSEYGVARDRLARPGRPRAFRGVDVPGADTAD